MNDKVKQVASRTRNWVVIIYPESAPSNWRSILDDLFIEWVESPLHDKDVDPGTGEIKKAHWHVMLQFPSVKSFKQMKVIADKVNSPIPQPALSPKGVVRYMIHLDNPEKFQYKRETIIGHGGADIAALLKPTSSDRYSLIGEMMEYVANNDVTEMKELLDYARAERMDDWFPLLCDNSAYILGEYIKSNRHRTRRPVIKK